MGNLIVIVDRNELQSDKPTEEILALGDLEEKLRRFGWYVDVLRRPRPRPRCARRSSDFRADVDQPEGARRAHDQGQGRVVHGAPGRRSSEGGGTYRWHAGAPDDETFGRAFAELTGRIDDGSPRSGSARSRSSRCRRSTTTPATSLEGEPESGAGARAPRLKETAEYVAEAYGEALLELAERHPELVVLDADLASDCRVRGFELALSRAVRRGRHRRAGHGLDGRRPRAAGAAAGRQLVRVASSPRARTSRSTTHASEGARSHLRAPLRGADPGRAGQVAPEPARHRRCSARCRTSTIVQPGERGGDARASSRGPSRTPRTASRSGSRSARRRGGSSCPTGYELVVGPRDRCCATAPTRSLLRLRAGDAARGADGGRDPARRAGRACAVVDMPWLNRFDGTGSTETVAPFAAPLRASRTTRRSARSATRSAASCERPVTVFGVEGWPACGTPAEALRFHGLDGASLADRIAAAVR